jgi:quercetin dioxygenase-like cupin family protein
MASNDFAFTQLLRAYRKGIISEAVFEQQMNELTASNGGASENPLNISNVMAFRGDGTKARGKRLQRTAQSETMTFTIPANFHSDRENSHRGDQIIYVLEGSATARVAGNEQHIKAGDILTIPAGAMHTLRTDSEPLFGLTVFAPPEPA